jgi:hypothetical protein
MCAIYGEHRCSADFHTLASINGNLCGYCYGKTLSFPWPFRRWFIFPLALHCHWFFRHLGAELLCVRPSIWETRERSVNVSGLNLSPSPVPWSSSSSSIYIRPSRNPNVQGCLWPWNVLY